MSFRIRWSLSQAIWSTIAWTGIMLLLAFLCYSEKNISKVFTICLLLAIFPPFIKRWRQFYRMYQIQQVYPQGLFDTCIHIGHQRAFARAAVDAEDGGTWCQYVIFLDNGLMVTSCTKGVLEQWHRIISESSNYSQNLILLINCDITDARNPDNDFVPELCN